MEHVDKPTLIDTECRQADLIAQVEELYRRSDMALFALYLTQIRGDEDGKA